MNHMRFNNHGIKGFIPASMIDWPGKICSVVFLGGCGFRCPFCHNSRLALKPESFPDFPLEEILACWEKKSGWIDGVTVTGGEPTSRKDLPGLLAIFRSKGLKIKLDTNGSNPEMLDRIIGAGLIAGVSMDVKAPLTVKDYSKVSGVGVDPERIRRSIRIIESSGIDATFRTTVIPGLVEEPQLAAIRSELGDVARYVVQSFRNGDTMNPEFSDIKEFSRERVERMQRIFEVPSPDFAAVQYSMAV